MYRSPSTVRIVAKSRRSRSAEHVDRKGVTWNTYRILVWKWPRGRPRRRSEDNNSMDFREINSEDRRWMELAQNCAKWWAVVSAVLNI